MKCDQAANLRLQVNNVASKRAKAISIVSGKGGVGKSNIALNLSIELSHHHHRVLLVDLDVGMGNIDVLLGHHTKKSIHDLLNEHLSVSDILEEGPDDLYYMSGGTGFTDFFTMDQTKIDYFLKVFQKLRYMFDYIIFDIGAGVTRDSMFFILASDESIVITTPEPTSITDAYAMVKRIIYQGGNMSFSVIMNRAGEKRQAKKVMNQFQTIIRTFLKIETKALGILPDDPVVSEAVSHQTPFILWKNKAPISKAIKQLTSIYLNNTGFDKRASASLSFVQKLKHLLMER